MAVECQHSLAFAPLTRQNWGLMESIFNEQTVETSFQKDVTEQQNTQAFGDEMDVFRVELDRKEAIV